MPQYVLAIHIATTGLEPSINGFACLSATILEIRSGLIVDSFSEFANMDCYYWDPLISANLQKQDPVYYDKLVFNCLASPNNPCQVVANFHAWLCEHPEAIRESMAILMSHMMLTYSMLDYFSKVALRRLVGPLDPMVNVGIDFESYCTGLKQRNIVPLFDLYTKDDEDIKLSPAEMLGKQWLIMIHLVVAAETEEGEAIPV